MRRLHAETEVHAGKGTARQALGARSRPRRDAGAAGTRAQGHAHPTPDRGTSVWNHQGVDGRDPLQAAHPRKGQRGDQPSRSRLAVQVFSAPIRPHSPAPVFPEHFRRTISVDTRRHSFPFACNREFCCDGVATSDGDQDHVGRRQNQGRGRAERDDGQEPEAGG